MFIGLIDNHTNQTKKAYCDVVGDVSVLAENNPYLQRILLDYTYVLGDIACFEENASLVEVGLAYSQCTGSLSSLHRCVNLEYLNLYGVRGVNAPAVGGGGAGEALDASKEVKKAIKELKKALTGPSLCAKAAVEGRTKTCNITL